MHRTKRLTIAMLFCAEIAFAQSLTTQINIIEPSSRKTTFTDADLKLPERWQHEELVELLKNKEIVPSQLKFKVRNITNGLDYKRLHLEASLGGRPIVDTELVVSIEQNGTIRRIENRLGNFSAQEAVRFNADALKQILQEALLRKHGPALFTISETSTQGWLIFGDRLYPVTDFQIIDSSSLRHFTARVDENTGRIISYRELTRD